MTVQISRQQRRAMQRLAEDSDRAVEGDRRFFARCTDRTYRVRLISTAERRQLEIVQGTVIRPAADQAVFVALKQLAPGVRMKATVLGPRVSVGEELTDAEARGVFEGYADRHPWLRGREAEMRAAFERHRDADKNQPPSSSDHGGRDA